MERCGGIEKLYGKSAMENFRRARVCVVGIGGVGSWAVEALARSGIGHITMVDLDEICITNVNRQLHAMDGQIGHQKTAVMAKRIKAIHPECQIEVVEAFFSERNADEILDRGFDFIIDAIDQIYSKARLLDGCRKRSIPAISCGGAGGLRDPSLIKVDDLSRCYRDPLLHQVRVNLRKRYGFPVGTDPVKKIKGRKFYIDCIFSSESPVYPQCDGEVSTEKPKVEDRKTETKLNCSAGFGSSTHMTATFGFFAVARCLASIAEQNKP